MRRRLVRSVLGRLAVLGASAIATVNLINLGHQHPRVTSLAGLQKVSGCGLTTPFRSSSITEYVLPPDHKRIIESVQAELLAKGWQVMPSESPDESFRMSNGSTIYPATLFTRTESTSGKPVTKIYVSSWARRLWL